MLNFLSALHVPKQLKRGGSTGRLERKLGLSTSNVGEFHFIIEFSDLSQLDAAFSRVAARDELVEFLHFCVNSLVEKVQFALYRDFPDDVRHRGQERF